MNQEMDFSLSKVVFLLDSDSINDLVCKVILK
jgi:hypothetical protein